jgi:protein-disulfide isomerase/uncharacterized membrane protein
MTTETETVQNKGSWIAAVVTGLAGMGVSLYSTMHHMELKLKGHTDASCNINSTVSCDAVAASKYSEVFGIPLGVWGLGFFLAMTVLAITILINHKSKKEHEPAWFFMSLVGVVSSIVLGSISLGVLGSVCLICIGIYVLTVALAGIAGSMWGKRKAFLDFSGKTLLVGLSTAVISVAVAVLGFNLLKPTAQLPSELQDLPGKHDGPNTPPVLAPQSVDIPIHKNAYSGFGEDFRKGPDDAKIVIVEFADYMCPGCGQTAPVMEDLQKQLGQRALFVFKNFPLSNQCNSQMQNDMHPFSCDIAKLARCSGLYGKFWEYHLKAFAEQAKASKAQARQWGKEVGLTDPQMDQCLSSPDMLAKIRDDVDIANKVGVNSTPTIFINGKKYLGDRNVPAMRAVIDSL